FLYYNISVCSYFLSYFQVVFFFQAEDGIRAFHVTGVQTCALPIWARGSAEAAEDVADELIGHRLVAFPGDQVRQCRGDDDLRERGDHDRVAELGPHQGHLVDQLVVAVLEAEFGELAPGCRQRPTRELMTQEGRVELRPSPDRQPLGGRDAGEVLGDGAQEPIVDVDRVAHRPQVRYDALDVRQRRAVRQRTTGRLYHLDTEVGD